MRRDFSNQHCPRCNGNIFFENDGSGDSKPNSLTGWCLQCGYILYPESDPEQTDRTDLSMDKNESLIPGR